MECEPGLFAFWESSMTFLDKFSQVTGTDEFVNSGVGLDRELDLSKIDFDAITRPLTLTTPVLAT